MFTVQKALPLFNVFADLTNRTVLYRCPALEPGARGSLGGPSQCLRVDILPDDRQFAISKGNGEDPMVLPGPIRGFDSARSEADNQNSVSLRYELGGSGKVVSSVSLAFWSKFSNPACPRCVTASGQSSQRGEAGPLSPASR